MKTPHVSVCICTFKRPSLLANTLSQLANQRTDGLFTYSIVVADNDAARSAEETASAFGASGPIAVVYCVQPEQNIALARNVAVSRATGDFIAFIDDDEFPEPDWLWNLFNARERFGVDGVLGPVKPHFESQPPRWVVKGGFFVRPTHPTGYKMPWPEARSGNVMFRRAILNGVDVAFRPQFSTAGEDVDFFRRMMEQGRTFVWCDEAVVHEIVPASRCTRRYLFKRALLRGSNFSKHPAHRVRNATKSIVAIPCYTLALPLLAIAGQHLFVTYFIKLLDHVSRLFAFAGVPLVKERQT